MSPIATALTLLRDEIASLSGRLGRCVDIAQLDITDRAHHLPLSPPTAISPNCTCRLLQARDGWIALNLARAGDRDLVPAWLECETAGDIWSHIDAVVLDRNSAELLAKGVLLGLPIAWVGERIAQTLDAPLLRMSAGCQRDIRRPLNVIDLSALWAGPLCGAILVALGASVTRIESVSRPDPTRQTTPEFFRRLNHGKTEFRLDFARPADRLRLDQAVRGADILITSARPRTFPALGLDPQAVFAENSALVWVAITGHGLHEQSRVAFGDDAAAAGGLLRWTARGEPRFLGDALADPLTGLAAAVGAMRGVLLGGGVMVDAAMARCAAGAATICGARKAA